MDHKNKDERIAELEAEIIRLKTALKEETDRKLIDVKNRLQTVADNLPTGQLYQYMYNTRTGKMCMPYFGSNKWEDKLGISMEEAIKNIDKVLSMFHPDDLPTFLKNVEYSAKNLTMFEMEIRFGPNNVHLHLISQPRKDGECIIWDGIMTDITDKKLMEKELARSNHELQAAIESDRLKSTFLANISHEILTPLNGIVGIIQFLDVDHITPEDRREYIDVINYSSSHLIELLKDIIDTSKLEARQMNINPTAQNLNEIMYDLRDFFQTYIQTKLSDDQKKKDIALILDDSRFIDNSNSLIYIDALRLRQVLKNLIENSIKFTEKGHITFGYRLSSPNLIEFFVQDTGIGIDPQQHDKIFTSFHQVQQGNNRQYYGTGLGLNISQKLIKLMDGEMWLKSSIGEGTTFFFAIPRIPVEN